MEAAKPNLWQKHTLFFCLVSFLLRSTWLVMSFLLAYAAAFSMSVLCQGLKLSPDTDAEAC